uniref:Zinc finger CCCH domain-containing protein 14 n=1 Tax=Spermophilus dauricus TaxID=99837 RepID=A0A8C9QIH7_SPEDA
QYRLLFLLLSLCFVLVGKLNQFGSYEELPDYIMVMVANKKSQDQMTEDLSLFLGNNTIRFTVWYVSEYL